MAKLAEMDHKKHDTGDDLFIIYNNSDNKYMVITTFVHKYKAKTEQFIQELLFLQKYCIYSDIRQGFPLSRMTTNNY